MHNLRKQGTERESPFSILRCIATPDQNHLLWGGEVGGRVRCGAQQAWRTAPDVMSLRGCLIGVFFSLFPPPPPFWFVFFVGWWCCGWGVVGCVGWARWSSAGGTHGPGCHVPPRSFVRGFFFSPPPPPRYGFHATVCVCVCVCVWDASPSEAHRSSSCEARHCYVCKSNVGSCKELLKCKMSYKEGWIAAVCVCVCVCLFASVFISGFCLLFDFRCFGFCPPSSSRPRAFEWGCSACICLHQQNNMQNNKHAGMQEESLSHTHTHTHTHTLEVSRTLSY